MNNAFRADSLFEMKREREDPRLVSLSEAMPSTSNAEEEHRNDSSKKNAQSRFFIEKIIENG